MQNKVDKGTLLVSKSLPIQFVVPIKTFTIK